MHIKDGYVKRCVAGQDVAIATGKAAESFHGMIKLNGTASFIWDQLASDTTVDAVVAALCRDYDVDEARARADVEALVGQLESIGAIAS